MNKPKPRRTLFVVAVVLMAVTAVVTLLSGIGTSCVAWNAAKFPPFLAFVAYQPLYQALVILTLIAAAAGVWATWALTRRHKRAYVGALIFLVVNLVLTAIQMYTSNMLRGKTMPSDMRLYITIITLVYLLVLRLPGLRQQAGLEGDDAAGSAAAGAGLAMLMSGAVALSTPMWAGNSHMLDGFNLVYVLQVPLLAGGTLLALAGLGLITAAALPRPPLPAAAEECP